MSSTLDVVADLDNGTSVPIPDLSTSLALIVPSGSDFQLRISQKLFVRRALTGLSGVDPLAILVQGTLESSEETGARDEEGM